MFKHASGEIWNGDCLELMRKIPSGSVDYVITSPPYNLGEGMEDKGGLRIGHNGSSWSSGSLGAGYNSHSDNMPYDEYRLWQKEILEILWSKLSNNGAIFYNHKPRLVKRNLRMPFFCDLPIRQIVIWDRGSGFNHMIGAYKPVCEWVIIYAKPKFQLLSKSASTIGDVWRITPERNNDHPAPFPLELVERILNSLPAGGTVLDPFGGSGTTAIAAHRTGRRSICIEKDLGYYLGSCGRIWKEQQ